MTETTSSPFGQEQLYRPRVSISMMLLLFAVTAILCCMILLAWQTTGSSGAGKINKKVSLAFLIVCYSAPLFFTAGVSLVCHAMTALLGTSRKSEKVEAESPFS
ncbi:MAG: hypothetical protein ACK56W_25500 [Pirellula sp.]|nr:hypothetical protein [Pirellula sp.]